MRDKLLPSKQRLVWGRQQLLWQANHPLCKVQGRRATSMREQGLRLPSQPVADSHMVPLQLEVHYLVRHRLPEAIHFRVDLARSEVWEPSVEHSLVHHLKPVHQPEDYHQVEVLLSEQPLNLVD